MGGTYRTKWLNENLAPLVRFLHSRVGLPWDEVYSEISARISCRSAVQKHVLDHLRYFVAENVTLDGDIPMKIGPRGPEPVVSYGRRFEFYVHPRSGNLCLAPPHSWKARSSWRQRKEATDPRRKVLSPDRELRRIQWIWYEVTVAPIPKAPVAREATYDVIEQTRLAGAPFQLGQRSNPLWSTGRYAVSKRQLSSREIARHGLAPKA
jgi:hypothetical protein